MENKKAMFIVIPIIIVTILNIGCSRNMNSCTFQSEEEMSEVISGIWRTGDIEFDFILTIENDMVNLSMDGKDDEGAKVILLFKGVSYGIYTLFFTEFLSTFLYHHRIISFCH